MSNMSDLDIILSEYKLSDPQKNAVLELISLEDNGGDLEAKTNTLNSLEKKGIAIKATVQGGWGLSTDFYDKIRPIIDRNKAVFEAFDTAQAVQEVMLTGGEGGDKADSAEDVKSLFEELADKLDGVDTELAIIEPYAQWELEAMGIKGWRNTDGAWDGLSRKEIKLDIKSAFGVNRAARRKHTKLLTSEYRKIMCPRPRKALKITGKVGV